MDPSGTIVDRGVPYAVYENGSHQEAYGGEFTTTTSEVVNLTTAADSPAEEPERDMSLPATLFTLGFLYERALLAFVICLTMTIKSRRRRRRKRRLAAERRASLTRRYSIEDLQSGAQRDASEAEATGPNPNPSPSPSSSSRDPGDFRDSPCEETEALLPPVENDEDEDGNEAEDERLAQAVGFDPMYYDELDGAASVDEKMFLGNRSMDFSPRQRRREGGSRDDKRASEDEIRRQRRAEREEAARVGWAPSPEGEESADGAAKGHDDQQAASSNTDNDFRVQFSKLKEKFDSLDKAEEEEDSAPKSGEKNDSVAVDCEPAAIEPVADVEAARPVSASAAASPVETAEVRIDMENIPPKPQIVGEPSAIAQNIGPVSTEFPNIGAVSNDSRNVDDIFTGAQNTEANSSAEIPALETRSAKPQEDLGTISSDPKSTGETWTEPRTSETDSPPTESPPAPSGPQSSKENVPDAATDAAVTPPRPEAFYHPLTPIPETFPDAETEGATSAPSQTLESDAPGSNKDTKAKSSASSGNGSAAAAAVDLHEDASGCSDPSPASRDKQQRSLSRSPPSPPVRSKHKSGGSSTSSGSEVFHDSFTELPPGSECRV